MKQVIKLGYLFLALLLVSVLSEGPGRAASRLTEDLTELLKTADAVVQVTVTAVHVQAENDAIVPFTVVKLSVEKVYKGTPVAGTEIQAEYIGGALNGLKVVSPGQAQLNVGDRAVLLLANVPGAKNWRILGGDAGQIVLARDGDGKELARRGSGRFEFYVADESSLTGYRPVKGTAIYANQLGALLQTVLETGRPVLEKQSIAAATILPPAPIAITAATEPSEPSAAGRVLLVLIGTTMAWGASRYWARRTASSVTV